MKRIGVFAGSFDPIHDGHLAVAESVVDALDLNKLVFVIESKPYGNKSPVDAELRQKMVELAIEGNPKLELVTLSQDQFTVTESLPELESKFPNVELYFVLGADSFMKMNHKTWPNLRMLFEQYIVVIERKDITEDVITKHAIELGTVIAILPSEHPHHSSTDIRLYPHKNLVWVPQAVGKFIIDNKLYS